MTRNEIYSVIRTHGKALEIAKETAKKNGISWTSLSNDTLVQIIDTACKVDKVCKKDAKKPNKCVDEGARKAIKAIATILNIKNIEKNFD